MGDARRLLVLSYVYPPSVGGIERVSELLVGGLRARGWDVRVVTGSPGGTADPLVLRAPTRRQLIAALRWPAGIVQSNVSIELAWPLIARLVRRPWIVVNHTPIADPTTRRRRPKDLLKIASLPRRRTYSVSEFLRELDDPSGGVMPNPYDERIFHDEGRTAAEPLLFVGRLADAKGVDVLLGALARLTARGTPIPVTVVGDGPLRSELEASATASGVTARFLGALPPEQVAEQMRAHRVLAVPSRLTPPEAFGLVAIEGIACGCTVVGTDGGGLPEAIGPCGTVVPVEDVAALADALLAAVQGGSAVDQASREAHLAPYRLDAVCRAYEAALERAGLHA